VTERRLSVGDAELPASIDGAGHRSGTPQLRQEHLCPHLTSPEVERMDIDDVRGRQAAPATLVRGKLPDLTSVPVSPADGGAH
jgi:hypothetical protein